MNILNKSLVARCLLILITFAAISAPVAGISQAAGLHEDDYYYYEDDYDLDDEYVLPGLLESMKEMDEYFQWYNSLPYSEQMRILKDDWAIQEQMRKDQEAAGKAKAAAEAAKPITLKVNGSVISTDSPPVIENGRTLAPVRAVVEALGYSAAWESQSQTIGVYNHDIESLVISMKIGSNVAQVSVGSGYNQVYDDRILETPAKLINGRTMVPVRFIAETLGCTVQWDQKTRTVSITQAEG